MSIGQGEPYIVCFVETVAIKTFCMCSINNTWVFVGIVGRFWHPSDRYASMPCEPPSHSCLCSLSPSLSLSIEQRDHYREREREREEKRWKCTQMSFIEYRFTLTSLGELRVRMLNVNMNKWAEKRALRYEGELAVPSFLTHGWEEVQVLVSMSHMLHAACPAGSARQHNLRNLVCGRAGA